MSDKLKEKVVGTSDAAPVGAKDGTLGAKDSVKQSVAKVSVARPAQRIRPQRAQRMARWARRISNALSVRVLGMR